MGQLLDHEVRVEYDENSDNGLTLCDRYVPEELISQLLVYVDYKSLVNCQLVCKRWKNLIRDYVWRKKAELIVGQSIKSTKNLSWKVNYQICHKKLFNKNLIKNHSGSNGLKNWQINGQGGDDWIVEVGTPVGAPELPKEAQLDNKSSCFVTSYITCTKRQVVDLIVEGFLPELLDKFQPSIQISEWYSCRWDCPAIYKCSVFLLSEQENILDEYFFEDNLIDEKQFVWLHVSHEFKNYGPGLRKIIFQHEGRDDRFWAGHYGSKMSGASVIVKIP